MAIILVINPGSTSTKIAIYEDQKMLFSGNAKHEMVTDSKLTPEERTRLRSLEIKETLEVAGYSTNDFDAIACRGGILPPLKSGTYIVNSDMVDYLLHNSPIDHPSNYAAPVGLRLSNGIPVFITDPVSVDEFSPLARLSGLPQIQRRSLLHALNMKAAARRVAEELDKSPDELNLVIAHLGGGISIGLQQEGKIVDVNNASDEGPFSANRCGELPVGDVAKIAFSGKYTQKELSKRYTKEGGLISYLGTDDLRKALELSEKDSKAKIIVEAMVYQIAKEIGGMCAIAGGKIDAIVLTGGMAWSSRFTEMLTGYISKFALVFIEPGENELQALSAGALRVINGEEAAKEFILEGMR